MCAIDGVIQKGMSFVWAASILQGEISRSVGLRIGVMLNDVAVVRGVMTCSLPTTLLVAPDKDLTG